MTCLPGVLYYDSGSDFVFPEYLGRGHSYTPVDIPIRGCGLGGGLAMIPQGPAHVTIPIRPHGHPDENFNWIDSGWWLNDDVEIRYESRDETHLYGVTKYPSKGKMDAGVGFSTGYWNPNAYWVPPAPGDPPPPGADPTAVVGQDPVTVDPPDHTVYYNKPFKYAKLKTYDLMGVNRTGMDLDPKLDVEDPEPWMDPYDAANPVLTFLYDDQDAEHSNLRDFEWDPDGTNCRNQSVAVASSYKEAARRLTAIARNRRSRKEIGVYSDWDSIGGQNTADVSEQNLAGHASAQVEMYGRPPNFLKLTLKLEPAEGTPERGAGTDPVPDWQPQPLRDFGVGDRVLARCRKGYADTGVLVVRITEIKISQADADNNVQVEIDTVPYATDLDEIEVIDV